MVVVVITIAERERERQEEQQIYTCYGILRERERVREQIYWNLSTLLYSTLILVRDRALQSHASKKR